MISNEDFYRQKYPSRYNENAHSSEADAPFGVHMYTLHFFAVFVIWNSQYQLARNMTRVLDLGAEPKHEKRSQQQKAEWVEKVHSVDQEGLLLGGIHDLQANEVQVVSVGYENQPIDGKV